MISSKIKTTLAAAAVASLLVGCVSIGPPKPSASYPGSFENAPTPKALAKSSIQTEDLFKSKNLDDVLGAKQKVLVSRFNVSFVTGNEAFASAAGGRTFGGGYSSGAKAKMNVSLANVNQAEMQSIADAAYADFLAQLKAAGHEPVLPHQFRDSVGYKGISFYKKGKEKAFLKDSSMADKRTIVTISPKGLPIWFAANQGDAGITDGIANAKGSNWMGKEFGANVITVDMTIDFANVHSSGNSSNFFGSSKAEVSANANLNLNHLRIDVQGSIDKNGNAAEWGWFTYDGNDRLSVGGSYGTLRELTADESDGSVFSLGGGYNFASAATSKSTYAVVAKSGAYKKGALDMIQASSSAFIKAVND